jgi:SOS-response transcriptional repressor LexA
MEKISSTAIRVLLAVVDLPRPTSVREVGRACGLSSPATLHAHLSTLKAAGLVAWEPYRARTLRPLVERVWP